MRITSSACLVHREPNVDIGSVINAMHIDRRWWTAAVVFLNVALPGCSRVAAENARPQPSVTSAPVKWKYQPSPSSSAQGAACCDVVNRGAAYADGRLFFNTLDGHTVAVDANSGKQLWKVKV